MFDLKVGFLEDQNFNLKRQLQSLRQILSIESDTNYRSVVYQLEKQNQQLSDELQACKDQLLLEKEAREIERVTYEQSVEELNRCIYQLKEQIILLENILRQEKEFEEQENIVSKWLKRRRQFNNSEILHHNISPNMLFDVLDGILKAVQTQGSQLLLEQEQKFVTEEYFVSKTCSTRHREPQKLPHQTTYQSDFFPKFQESSEIKIKQKPKWQEERSSMYFLKHGQRPELHLNLAKAKQLQCELNRDKKSVKNPLNNLTDVALLRRSYVYLIGEYELLKKKMRGIGRYVQELESRNSILLKSRLCVKLQ